MMAESAKTPSLEWLSRISPCVRPLLPGAAFRSYTNFGGAPRKWLEATRVIYDHELVMFAGADFVTEISRRRYPCPSGSFIIVPPGEWHVSYNVGRKAGTRYWTHFDWTYLGSYDDTPDITFHPSAPRPEKYRYRPDFVPGGVLQGTIQNLKRAIEIHERLTVMQLYGNTHEKLVSRAALMELLLEIFDSTERSIAPYGKPAELAERVRNVLENAFWGQPKMPPIQRLLAELGFSYAHLSRAFRAVYQITPVKFIHTLQITRAKMLLIDTDLSISEIGYRVGFNHPAYFAELFRQMTGTTPSAFREKG